MARVAGGIVAAVVISCLAAGVAAAAGETGETVEDSAHARALFNTGQKQFDVGDFEGALKSFQEAYVASPLPELLFNVGQCQRMLRRHQAAAHSYRRFLELSPQALNRAAVEQYLAEEEEAARREAQDRDGRSVGPPVAGGSPEAQSRSSGGSRWWIWAVVGGAVAAIVVGVGVAVGLTQGETPPSSTTWVFQSGPLISDLPTGATPPVPMAPALVRF